MRYALAGFPSGEGGAWTYCEFRPGDFASFLYGARAHNLYRVIERKAICDAERLPPWKPLTFNESGRTYSFPFRLRLEPVRAFSEPLVRPEFSYVSENLLLRGGYRKTHFQADQTTLQNVSQMGVPFVGTAEQLSMPEHKTFDPSFTRNRDLVRPPEVCRFQELILQAAIRHELQDDRKLGALLETVGETGAKADSFEVLGEKALTQGHIDLLLKQRTPLGSSPRIPLEVKTNRGQSKDVAQLRSYMDELGECPTGVLVASDFRDGVPQMAKSLSIVPIRYALAADLRRVQTFDEICRLIRLEPRQS
jgi:hypothetical protein